MSKTKTLFAIATILIVITTSGRSQSEKDAQDILKKVSETYSTLKSYHFEGTMVIEMNAVGIQEKVEIPFMMSASTPDKMRYEMKYPGTEMLSIFDGRALWMYFSSLKKYTKTLLVEPAGGKRIRTMDFEVESADGVSAYNRLAEGVREAKVLGDDLVKIEGKGVDCYVVEVNYEPRAKSPDRESTPKTFWINKADYIVLREMSSRKMEVSPLDGGLQIIHTTSFYTAKVNEPLDDALFVFIPPEDAKEVEEHL